MSQFPKAVLSALAAVMLLANAAYAVGLTEADVKPFDKTLDDGKQLSDAQLTQLEALIKGHPDEAYLRYLLARHQRKLGYTRLSLDTMREAQNVPDTSGFFRQTMEEAVANDDVVRALRIMEFAHLWHAQSDVGQALTAYFYKEKKQPALAEERIKAIMGRQASWPPGVGGLIGHVRYSQGKYREAIALADEDLRKDPHTVIANEVKGMSLVHLGNLSAAVAPLSLVFAEYPDNGRTTPSYTQALLSSGQYQKALRPALYSLVQAPDEAQLKIYEKRLASIISHVSAESVQAAIDQVVHDAHWTTQSYTFFFALAETFEMMHRTPEALRYYASAAQVNDKPTTALRRIGKIHQAAGRYAEAQRCYYLSVAASKANVGSALAFDRLNRRLTNRQNDIAWQFKDWIRSLSRAWDDAPTAKRSSFVPPHRCSV